ncbi:hypothetical protein VIBNIFTn2_120056 [Vibrio nigripulchritudo FTn2]|uniref:DUF6559 family protein n=1 Tax=Vibrio nigripulchritudo TaxID=28173 RepID=UPI0003B2112C|nr:DUF6559 family protein [Vibrio nigripulchritudo]CCN40074.1 hypothetical protein VIBNIFTn2_120056 [Vibrio nigripulchritudo FTn2]
MMKLIETLVCSKQRDFVLKLATEVNMTLESSYGAKECYTLPEISAALTEHGLPVKRNALNRIKTDPIIAHVMFMNWKRFLEVYAESGYQLNDYLNLRSALAKSLFKGTEFKQKSDAVLVSPTGLRLVYQTKLFTIEENGQD